MAPLGANPKRRLIEIFHSRSVAARRGWLLPSVYARAALLGPFLWRGCKGARPLASLTPGYLTNLECAILLHGRLLKLATGTVLAARREWGLAKSSNGRRAAPSAARPRPTGGHVCAANGGRRAGERRDFGAALKPDIHLREVQSLHQFSHFLPRSNVREAHGQPIALFQVQQR